MLHYELKHALTIAESANQPTPAAKSPISKCVQKAASTTDKQTRFMIGAIKKA